MSLVVLSCAFFGLGLFGVLARRDTIAILASVEVMLGGPLLLLVGLAATARGAAADAAAQAVHIEGIALLVIVIAAAEAAVGLALLVAVARQTRTTALEDLTEVRG